MRLSWWIIIALGLTCLWFGALAVGLDLRISTAEKQRAAAGRVVAAESKRMVLTRVRGPRSVIMADTSLWGKFVALPAPYSLLIIMSVTTSFIWFGCYLSSFLFRQRH
jgi:hypothetical protein